MILVSPNFYGDSSLYYKHVKLDNYHGLLVC